PRGHRSLRGRALARGWSVVGDDAHLRAREARGPRGLARQCRQQAQDRADDRLRGQVHGLGSEPRLARFRLRGAPMRRALALATLLLALGASRALAQTAPVDSLDLYLHSLADSTDDYFGAPSASFDTTGLDSLFAVAK